jgi:hypothetical protein
MGNTHQEVIFEVRTVTLDVERLKFLMNNKKNSLCE